MNTTRIKVLHVIPQLSARIGGPAVSVVESSLALRDHGIGTTIFATDMAGAVSARAHRRVTTEDFPSGADSLDVRLFPARWPQRWAFAPSMYAELGREIARCDVVHIHMLFTFPQMAAYWHAKRLGVPYIVSPCGALDPHLRRRSRAIKTLTERAWQRNMLDGAAALHFKTEEEARLVADLGYASPRVVVPNGVRCDEFASGGDAAAFRSRYGIGQNAPLVLSLGRLSHKKGLDTLVRAFAIVASTNNAAALVIAGPDDEAMTPRLRALARELGVEKRIVFTGMLRGAAKHDGLAAASVWALASHTENFGVAVVEAMASGLPVIITPDVNIAAEARTAGAAVVAPRTDAAFAGAISTLLRDDARRTALGGRARTWARRYDWAHVAPQWAAMYQTAATRRAGDSAFTTEANRAA